jgi:tetrahydromethanopterin S-methyltransferase subunit G
MARSQALAIEDLVQSFRDDITRIVRQAQRDVVSQLADRLSIVDGKIAKTQTNTRVLQSVDALFHRAMIRAGYQQAVQKYVAKFGGQFEFFQDTLDRIGKQIGRDLTMDFGKRDRALFVQQQVSAVKLIDAVVDTAAASAERQAMLSVGGMRLGQLIDALVVKLDTTVPQAMTIADTSLSAFYRTIADRGYQIIEKDLPDTVEVRYSYGGPDDVLVRPFCRNLLTLTRAGKTWTRAEIGAMSNGQLPSVWLTGGGWNCRHQWLLQPLVSKAQ